jgi:hypothetical protein
MQLAVRGSWHDLMPSLILLLAAFCRLATILFRGRWLAATASTCWPLALALRPCFGTARFGFWLLLTHRCRLRRRCLCRLRVRLGLLDCFVLPRLWLGLLNCFTWLWFGLDGLVLLRHIPLA